MEKNYGIRRSFFENKKMSFIQLATIVICFIMNMLDGMDVLVIAFTASAITNEWGISPESLGVVFSSGVAGMTVGALFIAPVADYIGRKKIILTSAILMGISIYFTAFSQTVNQLLILRFLSGLGIGSMLASASTLASEYSSDRNKDFVVGLVMGGYPIGAVVSGLVAAQVIPNFGWRSMFEVAGIVTLLTVPLILFFLSESLEFLIKKRTASSLEKLNSILIKMKRDPLEAFPDIEVEKKHGVSVINLFLGKRKWDTIKLWLSFFMVFSAFYFMLSWIPKLTTAAGLSEELGIYSATVFNMGSFVGILILGRLASRFGLKKTLLVFFLIATVLMLLFGTIKGSVLVLIMFGLIGFFLQGGLVGLYPLAARIYPTEIRSSGIGWAIGAGRLGAVLSPFLAGLLIGAGFSLSMNFVVFAVPVVAGAFIVVSIKSKNVT